VPQAKAAMTGYYNIAWAACFRLIKSQTGEYPNRWAVVSLANTCRAACFVAGEVIYEDKLIYNGMMKYKNKII
jgi:hypothetical protein